jgi:hypothetical protein
MDALTWLQGWYLSQCDGDWEHGHGVDIGTLDNPGWRVEIRVAETELRAGHSWQCGRTARSTTGSTAVWRMAYSKDMADL